VRSIIWKLALAPLNSPSEPAILDKSTVARSPQILPRAIIRQVLDNRNPAELSGRTEKLDIAAGVCFPSAISSRGNLTKLSQLLNFRSGPRFLVVIVFHV